MNEQQYYDLIHGKGQRRQDTNLVFIANSEKSIEERSVDSICPPPQLNPDYMPNPKIRRSGKLPEKKQPRPIDGTILRRILGK
jgi:hypothetical protein